MNAIVAVPPRTGAAKTYVIELMAMVRAKNPNEPEFHQAVLEVVESLTPSRSKLG